MPGSQIPIPKRGGWGLRTTLKKNPQTGRHTSQGTPPPSRCRQQVARPIQLGRHRSLAHSRKAGSEPDASEFQAQALHRQWSSQSASKPGSRRTGNEPDRDSKAQVKAAELSVGRRQAHEEPPPPPDRVELSRQQTGSRRAASARPSRAQSAGDRLTKSRLRQTESSSRQETGSRRAASARPNRQETGSRRAASARPSRAQSAGDRLTKSRLRQTERGPGALAHEEPATGPPIHAHGSCGALDYLGGGATGN